jgi:thiol:disulfide interchange protein DsbD
MTPYKNLRFCDASDESSSGNLGLTLSTLRSMTGRRGISAVIGAGRDARALLRMVASAALAGVCTSVAFAAAPPEPLSVDAAFPLTASFVNQVVSVRLDVQPGHYLYADRFEVKQDGAPGVELQRQLRAGGKPKQDPNFGLVKVYTQAVTAQEKPKKVKKGEAASSKSQTQLEIVFQGCSEVAGICYPPARRVITLASGATDVKPQDAEAPGLKSLFKKQVSQ